jgi:hypothetical protein
MEPVETIEIGRHVIKIYQDEDAPNPRTDWDQVGTMCCWHRLYNLGDEQPKIDPEQYLQDLATAVDKKLADEINLYEYPEDWDVAETPKTAEELQALIQTTLDEHYVILPLYLYDHGGITMSTGSFGDPWDSGQVGFIYVSKEKARKEFGSGFIKYVGEATPGLTHGRFYRLSFGTQDVITNYFGKQVYLLANEYEQVKDETVWASRLEGEVETYDQYLRGDVYGYVIETKAGVDRDSLWGMFGYDYCLEEAKSVVASFADDPQRTFEFVFRLQGIGTDEDEALRDALAAFNDYPGEPESTKEI